MLRASGPFLTYILGGANPPPPPSNGPFCLKMNEIHAKIAGNQV